VPAAPHVFCASSAVTQRESAAAVLGCGVIAGPLFVGTFLVEGATRAHYNPLRHPVSSLALGEYGWTQTTYSTSGLLHDLFALPTFFAMPAACFVITRRFAGLGKRGWASYSAATGIIFAVTWVLAGTALTRTPAWWTWPGYSSASRSPPAGPGHPACHPHAQVASAREYFVTAPG